MKPTSSAASIMQSVGGAAYTIHIHADAHIAPPRFRCAGARPSWRQPGRCVVGVVEAGLTFRCGITDAGDPHAVDRVIIRPLAVLDKAEALRVCLPDALRFGDFEIQNMQLRRILFAERDIGPPIATLPEDSRKQDLSLS